MPDTGKRCGLNCATWPTSAPLGPCKRFAEFRVYHAISPASETCFRSHLRNSAGEPCCKEKVVGLFSTPTMVHICLGGNRVHGHEWCMVDWLEKAVRCNFCSMRFDTDRADARLNAEREAAEKEAAERQAEEGDEGDDTLYGLPSARERRAKDKKRAVQPTYGDERVVLSDAVQRETLEVVKERLRKVTTADLEKGYYNPLQYFREDAGKADGWF